ncbi:flagellar biosynthetic protein FliR [Microbacterium sp.]|uniref:flagellar biosynthetic protein FliR n=1 Tax=Microbacterium sp. TaxID=51671 RepID=UPI003A9510A2
MQIPVDLVWLESTMLAAVRITAFVFVAPPFAYGAIPARIRVMLAVGLAVAVAGVLPRQPASLDVLPFFGALCLQLLIGGLLGFLVLMCFAAVQAAGSLIDTFGGFQLAQVFDPQLQVFGAQFTRLFQLTAVTLLFVSGGYQVIVAGLVRSFTAVPVDGVFARAAPARLLVDGVSQLVLASVQIAGPLILVLFLADVALGLVTRGAPALNAFALGLPVKVLLALTLAGTVYLALPSIVEALGSDALRMLRGVGR